MNVDIIAEDRDENPVMVVEVKATESTQEDFETFLGRFLQTSLEFGMFVDLEHITLLGRDLADPRIPIETLRTVDILKFYDPDLIRNGSHSGIKRIYGEYVVTLVEAWLRDLAYHWKSETPPGTVELSSTGLLERLEGGMTRRDATIVVNPLR
jgi:hypothetical protein